MSSTLRSVASARASSPCRRATTAASSKKPVGQIERMLRRVGSLLDRRESLHIPIWEFSLRSFLRHYGRISAREIVLRYPLRTLKGIVAYRRTSFGPQCRSHVIHLHQGDDTHFQDEAARAEGGFLVALGFCLKPHDCPSAVNHSNGRFSHECKTLASGNVLHLTEQQSPPACRECEIGVIGTLGLKAGATVYVMTSAKEVARHVLIPSIRTDRFQAAMFFLCSYTVPVIAPLLEICAVQADLVPYCSGDCRTYEEFLLADGGAKDERTSLHPAIRDQVLETLRGITMRRAAFGETSPGTLLAG
jgi:hypothetical protein